VRFDTDLKVALVAVGVCAIARSDKEYIMSAEGTCGSLDSQPWAQNPVSMTEIPDYAPDPDTQERYEEAVEKYALDSYTPPLETLHSAKES
jgi:hypothetical protein